VQKESGVLGTFLNAPVPDNRLAIREEKRITGCINDYPCGDLAAMHSGEACREILKLDHGSNRVFALSPRYTPKVEALAPNARIHEDVLSSMPQTIAQPSAHSAQLDASALEAALRRHLRGEVRFDSGSRALYATDGSNYRQVPIGVASIFRNT